MKQLALVFLIAAFAGIANAQVPHFGKCPEIQTMRNVSLTELTGRWFEIMKYKSLFIKGKCITLDITEVDERNVSVTIKQRLGDEVDEHEISIGADDQNVWSFEKYGATAEYSVLMTDFDKFALAYACGSMGRIMNVQMVWILGRHPQISNEEIDQMIEFLRNQELSTSALETSDQADCTYE